MLTGLSSWSPTRTTTCGQRAHARGAPFRNAGWPRRAKQRHCSAPISSADGARGQAEPGRRDGEVELALGDLEQHGLARARPFDRHAGRRGAQTRQQVGEQRRGEVGRASRKTRRERRRIEAWRGGDSTRSMPRSRGRTCSMKLEREGGRLHAPAALQQQRIAELLAQARRANG